MTKASRSGDPTSRAALAGVGFTDIEKAERLWAEPSLSPVATREVVADFAVAADPDLALLLLSRLLASQECPADVAGCLVEDPEGRRRLLRMLGLSAGLGEVLLRHPQWWRIAAAEPGWPPASVVRAELLVAVGANPQAPMPTASLTGDDAYVELRRAYGRQMLRIANADLNA
ncbi:MAG: [glutamine synthetase] adenylyltransferase / [glutamine synthetase]-adenylyl-L-tyrosine, partial [Actinomycetota bacterium]|nr:[glutamine synthetase] adenylyltransferase / [glutamine synthetase]-adenylyl-L-tyrosine [Actinomycetota bacterium]